MNEASYLLQIQRLRRNLITENQNQMNVTMSLYIEPLIEKKN